MSLFLDSTRAALVVAHPSHELCIHGWLQQSRPYVCVLTDGGGRSGQSRLASTGEVLSRIGGVTGSIYGRLTDLQVYAAILDGDSELFVELVEELAQTLVNEQIDYVVGDAAEGYNVTHDICRVMIDAATELASRTLGRDIASFDFPLVGPADERQEDGAIWLHLDDDAFCRKMDAARDYSQQLGEDVETALSGAPFKGIRRLSEPQLNDAVDVDLKAAVLEEFESRPALKTKYRYVIEDLPLDALRVECLRPVQNDPRTDQRTDEVPFYELYGEKLVAAGRYKNVIRYREHLFPLAQAIWNRVERKELCVRSAY